MDALPVGISPRTAVYGGESLCVRGLIADAYGTALIVGEAGAMVGGLMYASQRLQLVCALQPKNGKVKTTWGNSPALNGW